jgi:hypothetical protein
MNDECFFNELYIACYKAQIDGYGFGHRYRIGFQPIVPAKTNADGTYNRQGTLEMYTYGSMFTDEQKAKLLEQP